jgi:hypothetical protein
MTAELMPPQPALGDRVLDAGAVLGWRTAGVEEGVIDEFDVDPATGSVALAISTSLRAAA